jgi:predicted Zn-ribbon and HTH transcriptional regulator
MSFKGRCRKCGFYFISTNYNVITDALDKKCHGCGFTWTELPLDRKNKGKIQ